MSIKRFLLSGFSLVIATVSFAQDQKAQVDVTVMDSKNRPRDGQVVVFTPTMGNQTITAQTNKQGRLTASLPVGDNYKISIKDMAETGQPSTLSIPELKPGETLSGAYKVNIVYEPARTLDLNNVQFESSKATLKPTSYQNLQELIDYLKVHRDERVEIGGHTDSSGTEEKNVILSQARAEVIKQYLVRNGIPADNIVAKGYGSSQPIAENITADGKAKNRRIEVKRILPQQQ